MSEQKTVFNKLWKSNSTELASQKVELALMDDIKAGIAAVKSAQDSASGASSKASTALIAYADAIRAIAANANKAIAAIDELDAKSKDLGLGDQGLGGYKKELAQKSKDAISKFKQLDSAIKSL